MSSGTKNTVSLIGNVGKEPDGYTFADGTLKAAFSLATKDTWKDDQQQRQEKTQWHNVVVFGGAAEIVVRPYRGKITLLAPKP